MSLFVKPLLCIAMSLGLAANNPILKEEEPETGVEEPVAVLTEEEEAGTEEPTDELNEEREAHTAAGCIEYVRCTRNREVTVFGWAFDPDSPNDSVRIRLIEKGKSTPQGKSSDIKTEFTPNQYRDDIIYEGNQVSGNYGFRFNYYSSHDVGKYELITVAITKSGTSTKETIIDQREIEIVQENTEKILFDDNTNTKSLNMKPGEKVTVPFKVIPEEALEGTYIECAIENMESMDARVADDMKSVDISAKSCGHGFVTMMLGYVPSVYAKIEVTVSENGDDPDPRPTPTITPGPTPTPTPGPTIPPTPTPEPGKVNMFRMYNPNSGEHFYTGNVQERNMLINTGWKYEGVGFKAQAKSNTPMYRLYNPNAGEIGRAHV